MKQAFVEGYKTGHSVESLSDHALNTAEAHFERWYDVNDIGEPSNAFQCPDCGKSGFDGRGHKYIDGKRMHLFGCWNCGLEFAAETGDTDE